MVKETEMDPKAILIAILKEAGLTESLAKRFLESLVPYMAAELSETLAPYMVAELSGTKQDWKDQIIEIAKRREESFKGGGKHEADKSR